MMRGAALLIGLLLGLILLLPARLLLPAPPLAAAQVQGSIWSAVLTDAALGQARIGTAALTLQSGALLKGRAQWQLSGALNGAIWRSLAGGGSDNLSGQLAGAPLPGLPIAGVSLSGITLALDGRGRCQSASGQAMVTLGTALAGQTSLAGAPRCDGSTIAVPLASADGRVRLDLALRADGWASRLIVAGAVPGEAAALAAAGFRAQDGALALEGEGRW